MQEQLSFAGLEATPSRRSDHLFFALRPDAAASARIAETLRDLRLRHRMRGNAIAPEHFHVSLFLVGEYDGLRPEIVRAAQEAGASLVFAPFRLVFDRAQSFLNKTGRRPLVLSPSEGVAEVMALRQSLLEAAVRAGLRPQARPSFTPHLTLLYGDDVIERAIAPIAWIASEFALIHSFVGQTKHIALGRWGLRG